MKKILLSALTLLAVVACSKFDDSEIWSELKEHEERIVKLETLCNQMNTNITSLQTIIIALQNNDYVTNISPIEEGSKEIGYTITFARSGSITIYHGKDGENGKDGVNGTDGKDGQNGKDGIDGKDGKDGVNGSNGKDGQDGKDGADGKDGKDGYTPKISVKQHTDGRYYWTLDGNWLLDDNGNMIPATGEDGKDGTNGSDGKDGEDGKDGINGTDGKDGKDGITPLLKIEDGYWYLSYDNGATWQKLGKATGNNGLDGLPGADGTDGEDGDSIINSITQDDENVYFNLCDGTLITLPKRNTDTIIFEDLNVKAICCKKWDTNYDGELSYTEAEAITKLSGFNGNTNIIAFNELKYFTNITTIPDGAFEKCTNLWKISLPENIISIGNRAFSQCKNLTYINIPSNVQNIGGSAFSLTNLSRLIIPDSVQSLGEYIFNSCKFDYLEVGSGITEASYPFRDATIKELVFKSDVPDGVSYSYDFGFFHYGKIEKITFAGNTTYIGSYALGSSTISYSSLPGVKVVVLEDCVKEIGDRAMCNSTLERVYCKSSTPPKGSYAMFYSSSIEYIYVPLGTGENYKTAPHWKDYASKIVEFDFDNNPIE